MHFISYSLPLQYIIPVRRVFSQKQTIVTQIIFA